MEWIRDREVDRQNSRHIRFANPVVNGYSCRVGKTGKKSDVVIIEVTKRTFQQQEPVTTNSILGLIVHLLTEAASPVRAEFFQAFALPRWRCP